MNQPELVFLLEELSSKVLLQGLLPKFLPAHITPRFIVFEGKQDLEKQLARKLRGYAMPNAKFVVLRDQDNAACELTKVRLKEICESANKPNTLIRIACRELESWYLGDLVAVESAFSLSNLASRQNKKLYRVPDLCGNPVEELRKLIPTYQKVSGSRVLGPHLDIDNNSSHSFNVFIQGVRRLAQDL